MSSPYRHDAAAIRERRASITRELDEAENLLSRVTIERDRLRFELSAIEERLRPMSDALDLIRVASPCRADWRAMTGDDRVRFRAPGKHSPGG